MFSAPMDPTTITFDNHNTSSDEETHEQQQRRSRRKTNKQSKSTYNKPRGRPYGSKNKPKPPIIITRNSPNTLTSHLMEIPPTHDILQSLTDFAAKRQRGLSILTASGTVSNVSLRQPPPPQQQHQLSPTSVKPPGFLSFTGRFEILSMSGAFLPPPAPPAASGLSVFLSGGGGQVVGGKVVGPFVAAGLVVVMAASFANSPYDRLPLAAEDVENDRTEEHDDTVPGTVEKISSLIPQDTVNHQEQQSLMNLISTSTTTPTPTSTSTAAAGLFHGFGGNAHNEEFWGGGAFAASRPPF